MAELKTVDMYLSLLANAPIDHHGRAIVDSLPDILNAGLTNIITYMDSRFKQTEQYRSLRSGCLNTQQDLEYAYTTGSLWDDSAALEKKLLQTSPVDAAIRLEYLDLPFLHCFGNTVGERFMEALGDAENIQFFN